MLIHTTRGSVEACLVVSPEVRTLDFLNLSRRFVSVEAHECAVADWSFEEGRLGINKEMILFVAELSEEQPATNRRIEAAHFTRDAVSLRVADCDIKGYIHVRGIHDPVMVLNQERMSFLALTAASVVAPDFELAARFLAVNPSHVLAAQTMSPAEADPTADPPVSFGRVG